MSEAMAQNTTKNDSILVPEEHSLLKAAGDNNTAEFTANGDISPMEILHRERSYRIRDCTVSDFQQLVYFDFGYDIDGIVSTMKNFINISKSFSYMGILPRKIQSMIKVFNILRKHLELNSYSEQGLQYLRWSNSIKILDVDGYEIHLTLLPKPGKRKFKAYNKGTLEKMQYDFYEMFRLRFSECVMKLPHSDLARGTFKKNRITDVRKWHVLPDDKDLILNLLDKSVKHTKYDDDFEFFIIAFKLGDRNSSEEIEINAFGTQNADTTVHVAVTISSVVLDQHLFWSRFGLQDVVGDRGSFLSALSLSSCANFQTNLDGRCIDISFELRKLCKYPQNLRFLQFYADTPHLSRSYIHPVLGVIITSGILHSKVLQSLEQRSEEYLRDCKENFLKLDRVNARAEIVCKCPSSVSVLRAKDYISTKQLRYLIERYPILVPFAENIYSRCHLFFSDILRSVPQHIYETLSNLYGTKKHMGGFFHVWEAYQYEIANEKFWSGKTNSYMDNNLAVNLGPGGFHPSRDLTWERGFLCLDDPRVCALNELSTPPLNFLRLSKVDEQRIARIFNFSDVLNGSVNVVGKRTVLLLLQDLLADPCRPQICDRSLLSDLRGNSAPRWGRLSGAIKLHELCHKLCLKQRYKYPYVFGRALQMIENTGRNSEEILQVGFKQLRLSFFPDVRYVDRSNNAKMQWMGLGILRISYKVIVNDSNPVEITRLVINFLELNNLVYSSKFVPFLENESSFIFPWILDILLNGMHLPIMDKYLVEVCGYLTCIGLMQNHWYVNFREFKKLHLSLNLMYSNLKLVLQRCEILSKFSLAIIPHLDVMKLHESLPTYLAENEVEVLPANKMDCDAETRDVNDKEIKEVDEEPSEFEFFSIGDDSENIETVQRKHLTMGCKRRWSPQEIEILHDIFALQPGTEGKAYVLYLKFCDERNIQDRTFKAFKLKFARLFRSH